jgi:hypothetical protein
MAVVSRPLSEEDSSLGVKGKCSFCGAESRSYWWKGGGVFEVCESCALDKLPLLIADATGYRLKDQQQAEAAFDRIGKAFWRGLAIHGMREKGS